MIIYGVPENWPQQCFIITSVTTIIKKFWGQCLHTGAINIDTHIEKFSTWYLEYADFVHVSLLFVRKKFTSNFMASRHQQAATKRSARVIRK